MMDPHHPREKPNEGKTSFLTGIKPTLGENLKKKQLQLKLHRKKIEINGKFNPKKQTKYNNLNGK